MARADPEQPKHKGIAYFMIDMSQPGVEVRALREMTSDPTVGQFQAYCMFTPAMSIAGGSDDVNCNIIGERVLGLPREPGEAEQRSQPRSMLSES
jgi:alkylation response protein AidB-like acyl-CoA dehydrogenase